MAMTSSAQVHGRGHRHVTGALRGATHERRQRLVQWHEALLAKTPAKPPECLNLAR